MSKEITLKELTHKSKLYGEYVLYVTHDISDVNVKAVLKIQVDKALSKYNVNYISELYDNPKVDWEDVQKVLDVNAYDIEAITVLEY